MTKTRLLNILAGAFAFSAAAVPGYSASFTVTDSDFVGGVYDFHFYTKGTDRTIINGVNAGVSNPTLTNSGWNSSDWDPSVSYWKANSTSEFGAAPRLQGDLTMGWDFSAVSGKIAKIEVKTRQILFQFAQWNSEAFNDVIDGYISTPTAFGTGTETQIYEYTGNKPIDNVAGNDAIGQQTLQDVTGDVDLSWLNDPNLLEFRFGYDLANLDIPARHLQLFRDNTGAGDDGFVFRVTLESNPPPVPLPASFVFLLAGLTGLGLFRRRNG